MTHTILYSPDASRSILVVDPPLDSSGNPIMPGGQSSAVAVISDTEAAKLNTVGSMFSLAPDNQTVVVTAAPVDPSIAAGQEAAGARTDLAQNYQTALSTLDQIIGNTNPTNAQRDTAIHDLATILKRTIRLVKDVAA